MNQRIQFLISENLPRNGVHVDLDVFIDDVAHDLASIGTKFEKSDIQLCIDSLNEKQYIVLFRDGTIAMTEYGNRMMS
jgi:hypothetical protein